MVSALFALLCLVRAAEPRVHARARVGTFYDSNILISPDSMFDQGEPSRLGDYRLATLGEVDVALVASERQRWSAAGLFDLINSARANRAAGDPYRAALSLPYQYDRGPVYRAVLRPTVQALAMDPTLTTRKSVVQDSVMIAVENRWRTAPAWATTLDLEYRRDESGLRSSVGDDDADATKLSAYLGETWVGRTARAARVRAGYVANLARGQRRRYARAEAGLSIDLPITARARVEVGVTGYHLNYPRGVARLRDVNVSGTASLRYAIDSRYTVGASLSYARNFDSNPFYAYRRFTAGTELIFARGF